MKAGLFVCAAVIDGSVKHALFLPNGVMLPDQLGVTVQSGMARGEQLVSVTFRLGDFVRLVASVEAAANPAAPPAAAPAAGNAVNPLAHEQTR